MSGFFESIFKEIFPKGQSLLLKTGQETSYHADDDGDLELGVAPSFGILTTGQYSGNTTITINGKALDHPNACVKDNNTKKMWLRHVPQSVIGPAANGRLFWKQWTLAAESCTFNAAAKTITAAAGTPFNADVLCAGRKITLTGTVNNNQVVTVASITTSVITTVEVLVNEGPVDTTFATLDDLIWDFLAQANANNLGGHNDWRIPNRRELESIVDIGHCNPAIDATVFPSTPSDYHWTVSTYPCNSDYAFEVNFYYGRVDRSHKETFNFYVRLVRE